MKKLLLSSSLVAVMFLTACGAAATIGNVSIPDSAKNPETSTVGKTTALHYLSDSSVDDACTAQVKLLTEAKWTEKDPMVNKGSYSTATYTNGSSDMVLLCGQTEVSATAKSTKVTLTLMTNN